MQRNVKQSQAHLEGWTSTLFRKRPAKDETPGSSTSRRESKRFKFQPRRSFSRSLTCLTSPVKGQLKVAVYKNSTRVLVDVLEASFESVNHDLSTYVQVSLETRDEVLLRKFTKLRKKKNKPVYKEVFWFSMGDLQLGRRIVLTVFESVQKSSIFIGSMSFGVKHILTNNKVTNGWFYLLEAETGRRKHLAVPPPPDHQIGAPLQEMNGRERQNNILPRLRVFNVTLSRDHRGKYGFKFRNTIQASVGKVQPGGPADLVGVKEGDTFLELDGFNVAGASSELISAVLKQSTGYVTALLQRTAEVTSPVPKASQTKRKPRPMSSPNLFYRTSTGGRKYIFSPGLSSPMQRVSLSCRRKLDKNRGVKVSPYSPLLHRRLQRELAAKVATRQSQMQMKLESTDPNGADSRCPTGEEKNSRVERVIDDYNDEERLRCPDIHRGASHGQSHEEGVLNNHMTCQEVFGTQEVSSESRQSETNMTDEQVHDREDSSDGKVCLGVPFIPVTTARPDLEAGEPTEESTQSKASSTEVLQSDSLLVAGRTDTLDAETTNQQHHHRHPLERLQNETEATKDLLTTDQANNSFECEIDERKCHVEGESESDQGKVSEKRHLQEDDEPTVISAPVRSELRQGLQTSLLAITASDSPNHNTNASPLISDGGGKAEGPRSNVRREYPKQGTVSFVDGVKPFLMSTAGREYVHVDRLLVQREGKRLQKLVVLLLTDVIVFGKLSTSGHFKVIYDPLHLDDISWLDSNCRKASEFRILLLSSKHPLASSRGSSINLVAPSPKCKRVWIRHLQQQLMIVKYQGLKKCMAERNLIPMESSEKQSQDKSKKTEKTRNEDRCVAAKYSACAMESNNNSNSESNHYSRLLSELSGDEEDMPSPKCNGPAGLTDRKGLALAHLDVEGAEKWSEGLRMPSSSSSTQGSKPHRGGSPSDGEDASSNGDDRPNSYPHTSFSSPVNHSHSNSLQLVQSSQSTPTVSHRESFKRAKSAPSISPNSPMSCLVVKHPEKKLVRRQSSPPGALKENNSLSIGSKFRKTIFRRFTGNHREENNVQSSVAREVNKKDAKKTKRGFHSFSSSPQLNIRLSDTNSSSLQRIPHEEMMMNDVETRSLQDQPTRKTKSIAKEIKAKVQFLRRRHTEGSLQETEENVNPNTKSGPDLEDIRRWAEGFESLLKDEFGLEAFRKFLQTEFSDENIEFWLACEEYKNLKPSKMVARAHKIYEDYVTIQAPREVNLDSRTRLQVVSNLSHPNKHSFEQAQKRIEALMEKDSYPRFLRSDIYIKMQKAAKKNK